jgi:hypothetical protein
VNRSGVLSPSVRIQWRFLVFQIMVLNDPELWSMPARGVLLCHSLTVITRANRLILLAIAVIATLFVPRGDAVIGWAIAFLGYLVSLWLHPHYNCRRCGGTGRHSGALYAWGNRRCNACGGQGRHRRIGTVIFSPGKQVWAERRQVAAGRRFNRPL